MFICLVAMPLMHYHNNTPKRRRKCKTKIAKGLFMSSLAIWNVVPLGLKVWYLVYLNDILILL